MISMVTFPSVPQLLILIIEYHGHILFDNVLALLYRFWYMLFHVHSPFDDVSFLKCLQTSAGTGESFHG